MAIADNNSDADINVCYHGITCMLSLMTRHSRLEVQISNVFYCGLQFKQCREAIPPKTFKTALEMEHKVLRSVVARGRKKEGFVFCVGWKLDLIGIQSLYIRSIAHGTISGALRTLLDLKGEVIHDTAVSQWEIANYELHSRSRATDASNIFKKFKQSCLWKSTNAFGFFAYIDKDKQLFSAALGDVFLQNEIQSHIAKSLNSHGTHSSIDVIHKGLEKQSLTLEEQIQVLNTVPAQMPTTSYGRKDRNKYNLPELWHILSPKYMLVNAQGSASTIAETANKASECVLRTRDTTSHKRRIQDCEQQASRRTRARMGPSSLILKSSENSQFISCSQQSTSPMMLFQQALIDCGHIRVLHSAPDTVQILWNKYDHVSSEWYLHPFIF